MKLTVDSIASEGLVYCGEIETTGQGLSKLNKAIHNILKSQKFDSIPIRDNNGVVKKVARRRLHDGDLDQEVFILDIEECATVPSGTSVLDAIFAVLSNEHHILFVMDKLGQPTRVLTISMLKETIVKDYLNLKISQLVATNWHWNNGKIDFTPSLTYGQEIYSEIIKLAGLVDDDKQPLSTDKEVSIQIIKILSMLQPLKDVNGEMKAEKFALSKPERKLDKLNVETMMSHPIASLHEDDKDVLVIAYRLFAKENNWDNVLLKSDDSKIHNMITGVSGSELHTEPIEYIKPSKEPLAIINKFSANGCKPMRSIKDGNQWPGIITIDDLALNHDYLMELIVNISDIEDRCRSFLLDKGELYIPTRKMDDIFVAFADWASVIDVMARHRQKGVLTSNGLENLDSLRKFRNTVIHEYLPLLKDEKKDFPNWYHKEYLSGVKNLSSCLKSLEKVEPNKDFLYAMVGLNKLLRANGLSHFKFVSSGLVSCNLKNVGSNSHLEFVVEKDKFNNWQQNINKLNDSDITSWTKCSHIDIISD